MAEIFAVNIEEGVSDSQYRRLFSGAGSGRGAKALRYRFKADERRCIYAGALLRYVLSNKGIYDYRLRYNEYGKPYLLNAGAPFFNLSHSGKWVLCGISDHEIGVDVEQMGEVETDIARQFFHPQEYAAIECAAATGNESEAFFSIWTLKESYIKYLGAGMSVPLDSFFFCIEGGAVTLHAPAATLPHTKLFDMDKYHKAAVCTSDASIGEIQAVSLQAICKRLAG